MPHSIKHLFHIAAPRNKVYDAIRTIEGLAHWWTIGTSGSDEIGGTLAFRFGQMAGPEFKVMKLVPGESVHWLCTAGFPDWIGTTLTFTLDDNDGKTRVRFEHGGWAENGDSFAGCAFSWGRYMESLRQLCQTGRGQGHGTPGYRK